MNLDEKLIKKFSPKVSEETKESLEAVAQENETEGSEIKKIDEKIKEKFSPKISEKGLFWYEKKSKNGESFFEFDVVALANILSDAGFGYGYMQESSPLEATLIRVQDFVIEQTTIKLIQKYAQDIIESSTLPKSSKDQLLALWKRQCHYLICETSVNLFPYFSNWKKEKNIKFLEMLKDTKECAYFPFRNGLVEASRLGTKLKSLDRYVWKSQIIQADFKKEDSETMESFDFYRFLKNTCSDKVKKDGQETINFDGARFASLLCSIGYMLHDYKRSWNKKALILSEASLDDEPQGRTGKGLIMQAIGKLRKVLIIDGRTFSFDSQFCYQNVDLDTKIIFFDDVKAKFDFRKLFSAITEGLSIEKKNKERINFPVEESPKITVSTNYAIQGDSESDKGRKIEMELLCYYSTKFKPEHEFGRLFFSEEWQETDWNIFYNIMFHCIESYLYLGEIPEYQSNVLAEKRLKLELSQEFLDFMDGLEIGKEYFAKELFQEFQKETDGKEWKLQTFTKAVKKYCSHKKLDSGYTRKRDGQKREYVFKLTSLEK